jgi:citrate synthase
MNSTDTAKLQLPEGQVVELPVVVGSEGERAVDITKLRAQSGYITLDPGFVNTGSCQSAITFIDGEKGILRYRGVPIEELAEKSDFLSVAYLLINGSYPTTEEYEAFRKRIIKHTMLHESIKDFFNGFPRDAHPMATLASVVCSLSTFYQHEKGSPEQVSYLNSIRLLAKFPTIISYSYKKSTGQPFVYPDNRRSYCENLLYMMFSVPCEDYEVHPLYVEIMNILLILHADHEQNCSTSTVRQVRSSMSNMFASIASGVLALWGHRHGGANQMVIEMLQNIQREGGNIKKYIDLAKQKDSHFRLFGFGHRVYKNFDPRAKIIKKKCHELLEKLKIDDPLFHIAMELEDAALKDDYFVERKLYPNVDFYSGILYNAMKIPVDAMTVMFALGRLPGWIAHAKEFTEDPENKISRPRQIYVGPTKRSFEEIVGS